MPEDLGARLVRAGLASRDQLAAALAEGAQSGSALAAGLTDAGVPEEDLIALFVAEGLGPEAVELQRTPTADRLPGPVAVAFLALPLVERDDGLEIAMADPSDQHALRELRKFLGPDLRPRPARVGALRAALAVVYPDAPLEPAAPTPLELVRRKPDLNDGHAPLPLARPKSTAGWAPSPLPSGTPSRPIRRLGTADYLSPKAEPSSATAPPVPSSAPPHKRSIIPPHEASWSDLAAASARPKVVNERAAPDLGPALAAIRTSGGRDRAVRVACEAGGRLARVAVFLILRRGVLRGWDGEGVASPDALRNLWLPATSPSVFQAVVEGGQAHRGSHGTSAADNLFRAAIGSRGGRLLVEPVRVGGRVVALLCLDDPRFPDTAVHAEELARATGELFERLIREGRRG
ncbi:MAG: hypothetical protein KF901_09275 [Myxococcales bacterium]|nr:hypothetical protein [Myxococcales bacterium]